MDKNKKSVDDYFEGGLKHLEIAPPEDVWKGVTQKLDAKRRIPLITLWSGMAAGIALLVGIGLHIQYSQQADKKLAQRNEIKKPRPELIALPVQSNSSRVESAKKIQPEPLKNTITSAIQSSQGINLKSDVEVMSPKKGEETKTFNVSESNPTITIHSNTLENNLTALVPKSAHFERTIPVILPLKDKVKQQNMPKNNNDLLAQEQTKKQKIKRWSIQGEFAPLYAYRTITSSGGTNSKNEFDNTENGLMTYAGMVKVNYQINRKFFVQTGIGYSMLGYTSSNTYALVGTTIRNGMSFETYYVSGNQTYYVINTSAYSVNQLTVNHTNKNNDQPLTGVSISNSQLNDGLQKVNGDFVQKMKLIEIPFLMRYRFMDSKVSLHLIGGIGANILLSSKAYLNDGSSQVNFDQSSVFHTFNLSSTLGVGLNYRLPNQMVLVIEPTYKYFINSITSKSSGYHPYAFGVYSGLNFTF